MTGFSDTCSISQSVLFSSPQLSSQLTGGLVLFATRAFDQLFQLKVEGVTTNLEAEGEQLVVSR